MSQTIGTTQPPKRKRRCACPYPGHQHGCANRYNTAGGGCHCPQCTQAHVRRRTLNKSAFFTNRLIPSTGSSRRLQALAVAGWPPTQIANRLGVTVRMLERWRDGDYRNIETYNAKRVADVCTALWAQTPTGRPASISRVRNTAIRKGWAPFAAWDDIDNPDDTPQGLRLTPADRVARKDTAVIDALVAGVRVDDATRAEIGAAIVHLTALGLSTQDIEARLAVPITSRWVQRARARARLEVAA